MTPNHLWKSSKITKAVHKKRYLHHMIWQILFISLSLCLHGCLNTSPHLSSVTRLRKDVLDTCVTLQALTIISYDNKDIKRVHVRTTMMTCVLFLFWCNIKSSFNDRCCWQCSSKRTTNHSKSMFVQVQMNKNRWVRSREWGGSGKKKVRDKSKNGREKRGGGTLGAWGRKKKMKDGNSISFRSGKVEQVETKKEIQA